MPTAEPTPSSSRSTPPMESTEPPLSRVNRMVRAYQDGVRELYGLDVFHRLKPGSPTYALVVRGMHRLVELRIAPEPWVRHVLTEFLSYRDRADDAPLEVRAHSIAFSAAPPPLNVVFAPGAIDKRLDRYRERVLQYITRPVLPGKDEQENYYRGLERKFRAERPGVPVLRMSLFPLWYRELRAGEVGGAHAN